VPNLHDPFTVPWVAAAQAVMSPTTRAVARLVAALGGAWGLVIVAGITRLFGGRRPTYAMLGAIAHEVPVYVLFTAVVRSERPEGPGVTPFEHVGLASFPSGHVALATVMFGVLARERLVPRWVSVVVPLAVAFARFVMGMHYLADLVGGAALGASVLAVTRRSWPPLQAWLARRSFRFFGAFAALNVAIVAVVVAATGLSPTAFQSLGLTAGIAGGLLADARWGALPDDTTRRRRLLALLGVAPALVVVASDEAAWSGIVLALVAAGTAFWLFFAAGAVARVGRARRA